MPVFIGTFTTQQMVSTNIVYYRTQFTVVVAVIVKCNKMTFLSWEIKFPFGGDVESKKKKRKRRAVRLTDSMFTVCSTARLLLHSFEAI